MSAPAKAILLLGLVALGLWWARPGGDDERLADTAALARWVDEVRVALAQGAGIELPHDVPVLLLDANGARERRRAFLAGQQDAAGLAATVDRLAQDLFGDNLLGRYLPDEKVVYVMQDVLLAQAGGRLRQARELLFPVLAHELVHAHDDQVYGCLPDPSVLADVMQDPGRLGELQALMSVLEGHASQASTLACRAAGVPGLPEPTLEDARRAELLAGDGTAVGDFLASAGNTLARLKFVQYAYGVRFAQRAFAYGGEAFFAQVFGHLPLSLAELEDFDRFVLRWAAEMEQAEDASVPPVDARDVEPHDLGAAVPVPAQRGPSSAFWSSSRSVLGFALPPEAFIVQPRSALSRLGLPAR